MEKITEGLRIAVGSRIYEVESVTPGFEHLATDLQHRISRFEDTDPCYIGERMNFPLMPPLGLLSPISETRENAEFGMLVIKRTH